MPQTSLFETHKRLGAKMISFGGWDMPRDYGSGTAGEVKACRTGAALFDVSHMGEFRVVGEDALAFIQYLTTNDASSLIPGKAQYSLVLNESGGVKDDVIVYKLADDDYRVVVNAGCKDKDWLWFELHAKAFDVTLTDESESTALIAVQGPGAIPIVNTLAGSTNLKIRRFHFAFATVAGINCCISRTGYTGEDGYELFCHWNDAPALWDALISAGAVPCGLAARDVLRLEAAYPLYGHEFTEQDTPLGNNVAWAIKTSKPDFIGRDDIVSRSQDGLREKLIGITMDSLTAIPREGFSVYVEETDEFIGRVTSGTLSPSIGQGIALARVGSGYSEPGTKLTVDIRGRRSLAAITPLPFYRGLLK